MADSVSGSGRTRVSDRLLGVSPVVAIAGVAGIVVAFALYGFSVGAWLPKGSIGSSEAESRARAYAAAQSVDVTSSGAIVRPTWMESAQLEPLVDRIGLSRLQAASKSGQLPIPEWRVDFRRDLWTEELEDDPGGFTVTLAGNGSILQAEFYGRARAKAEKITRADARAIVESLLRSAGVDVAGSVERGDAVTTVGANIRTTDGGVQVGIDEDGDDGDNDNSDRGQRDEDVTNVAETLKEEHRFTFERVDPEFPDAKILIDVRMDSSGLLEFERRTRTDASVPLGARGIVSQVIEGIAMVFASTILTLVLLGAFAFRILTRDFVSIWRACLVGLLFMAVVLAYTIVGSRWSMPGVGLYAVQFMASVSVGIVLVAAWFAGEADSYFAWGKQATEGALAALTGHPLSRQVAREAFEGTLWGFLVLGVVVAIGAIVAITLGPQYVIQRPGIMALDARPIWMFAVTTLPFVYVFAVLFLLFLPAWLHRLTRRAWIAIPLAAIVAAPFAARLGIADLRFDLLPGSVSWGLLLSVVCMVLVVRRGFLTGAFALFTFSAFFYGIGALVSAAPGDRVSSAMGLVVALAPAIAAVVIGSRLPEVNVREAPPPRVSAVMDQARRHEELDIARRVQAGLLPSRDPSVVGFDIAGMCLPANEVGGDYYDYFTFDDGRFGLAVGDVSGKGVPAAFCMTLTKGFMEVAAAECRNPDEVLVAANSHLREYLSRGTFVTMTYAVIDPEALTIDYARAGHNPPAMLRTNGEPSFVMPSGTALGAADRDLFAELIEPERLELQSGDAMVFYTDGVTEAMSSTGEQFGEARLLESLARLHDGRPARELADGLLAAVAEHAQNAEQHDDITVVVVRARGAAA